MTYYFWGYEDGIVADDDGVLACETCPCTGTSPPVLPYAPCTACPDGYLPAGFSFQISGMTNGTCGDCVDANGTWNVDNIMFNGCFNFKHFLEPNFCGGILGLDVRVFDGPAPGSATGTAGWYLELHIYYAFYLLSYETIVYRTYQPDSVQCYELFEEPMEYHTSINDRGVCTNHSGLDILVTAYN